MFAGEVEGEIALAAALKFTVGAQLARAKSVAFKIIYKYRIGDGNQREVTADFSLESLGAPRITLSPQFKLMV